MLNILVCCDDTWHPGEVIARGLKGLEKRGFALDVVSDCKDILTKEMIRDYDAIIVAKGDCHSGGNHAQWFEAGVTAVMPEELRAYVEEGHGLLALHAGNCFRKDKLPEMCDLIGNSFITHPPQCAIDAKIVKDHPVLAGVEEFTFRDEHYCIEVIAPDADVFLHTVSDSAGTQIGGYSRDVGKGKVVVLTPGHNCAVLQNAQMLRMVENALHYCAGK